MGAATSRREAAIRSGSNTLDNDLEPQEGVLVSLYLARLTESCRLLLIAMGRKQPNSTYNRLAIGWLCANSKVRRPLIAGGEPVKLKYIGVAVLSFLSEYLRWPGRYN
jgi:hypothetical protein